MKSHLDRPSLGVLVAGSLFLPSLLVAQQGLSHVRVVRLSYVSGTVAVRRSQSAEWAKALVNTPIQEGYALSTSNHSFAEVQFENGSTARLGELSELEFMQLAMDAEGAKLNRLTLDQGYATLHFLPEHHDVYSVSAAGATLTPDGKSEFRADVDAGRLRAEVFSGSVDAAAGSLAEKLGKDKVLDYDPRATEALKVSQGITKDSWDAWTEARDKQTVLALNDQAIQARGPLYGWSDLDAYGEWASIPGYGLGWAPYEPLGWSPYTSGLWNMYPGFGWTWISGEPWGWLPYHYGLWNYDASLGWFWMPGDFGFWSPALVSWYSGPGWIGWAPYGAAVPPGYRVVTAVPKGRLQNGQPINESQVIRLRAAQGTPVSRPPVEATALAMISGTPLAANATLPGRGASDPPNSPTATTLTAAGARTTELGGRSPATSSASGTVWAHSAAPPTVLMGGDAATERALLGVHHSALARFWGVSEQPLRAQMGATLGGRLRVSPPDGEPPAEAFRGVREFGGSQPAARSGAPLISADGRGFGRPSVSVLPHASAVGASNAGSGEMHGGSGGAAVGSASASSSSVSSPASVGTAGARGGGGAGGSGHH